MATGRTKDDDVRKEPAKKVPPRPKAKPSTTDRARRYQYVQSEAGWGRDEAKQKRKDKRNATIVTGAGKGGKENVSLPKPVMYKVEKVYPSYMDSEAAFEDEKYRPDWGRGFARGLPQPTRPTNATVPSSYYKPDQASGNQERPGATYPPATTGPVVGPPGYVKAITAPAFGYSDQARGDLSRTSINWAPIQPPDRSGAQAPAGTYEEKALNLNSSILTPATSEGVAAHEMSHKRWFNDLDAQDPEMASDYFRDTTALEKSNPAIRGAMDEWRDITPYYQEYHGNKNAGTDLNIAPTEIHARVAERVSKPEQLPDWYRKKWYPDVWQDEQRGMNQRNRFDQEWESMYAAPDENGNWGKLDPPRRWRR